MNNWCGPAGAHAHITGDAIAASVIAARTSDVAAYVQLVGGDDRNYTGQWPQWQWQAAATMYAAFPADATPGRTYEVLPNPVLPEWLRRIITGRASLTVEGMAPAYCWLWAETRNWFTLAAEHPDVLTTPTAYGWPGDVTSPDALRAAWTVASDAGCTPVLKLELAPDGTEHEPRIAVNVEGFYIVTPDRADHRGTVGQLAALLGFAGAAEPNHFRDAADVYRAAEIAPGRLHAWERW